MLEDFGCPYLMGRSGLSMFEALTSICGIELTTETSTTPSANCSSSARLPIILLIQKCLLVWRNSARNGTEFQLSQRNTKPVAALDNKTEKLSIRRSSSEDLYLKASVAGQPTEK